MHLPDDGSVELKDVTEDFVCIGMWGPRSRAVLQAATKDDVSNAAFPYMSAKWLRIAGADVWAQRMTYVGELGWEMYAAKGQAAKVWDALWSAGQPHEMQPAGYKCLDSLRLEKGYRYWSSDITPLENPLEAGLGFCVKFSKGDFIGKEALQKIKAAGLKRKLATITLDIDTGLYGGEAVYGPGNQLMGRLRSGGFGYTVGKTIGLVYLPLELAQPGTPLEVEIFGERVKAEVAADVLYDPKGERLRS